MRTAEEIAEKHFDRNYHGDSFIEYVAAAINEARKESIEECKSIMYDYDIDEAVSKIDSLITQLK